MADLLTTIRRALRLEHRSPEPESHDDEHDMIDRQLDRHELRLKAIDARIKAQTARHR